MAFEKAKVLKTAEKFLSQGNIAAAIQEYRQIVEHDEDDYTTLNMLGDLCVRAGKKDEAISCFKRIAEYYREKEFTLKAIAMYKKIDRLTPRNVEIAEKLAGLYCAHGLVVDARAQYLTVADAHSRTGDQKKALEVLHKIADLDPQNTDVRLKLAEGYLQEGLRSEALQAFTDAGSRLLREAAFEKSLQCFSRALEITPQHQPALSGVVSAHVALGTAYEATELLEKLLADNPDDVQLIALLLRASIEAQDAAGAERATTMLISHDASTYSHFLDVARLYLNAGDVDAAARVLAGITERALAGREENRLFELVNEVLARDPEHITALRLLVRIYWWQRDVEKLRAALERLAEAAQADELAEDERYALTQLARLVPDETRYIERLKDLGGVQEEPMEAGPDLFGANVNEVPTFESFAIVKDESDEFQSPEVSTAQSEEFDFHSAAVEPIADPSASFADLNEELERGDGDSSDVVISGQDDSWPEANAVDFDGNIFNPSANTAPTQSAEENDRSKAVLRQELESVDFYIAQGYTDIAIDTLEMLERQFMSHPEIEVRRAKLKAMNGSNHSSLSAPVNEPEIERVGIVSPRLDVQQAEEIGFVFADTQKPQGWDAAPEIFPVAGAKLSQPAVDAGLADMFEEFRAEEEEEEDLAAGDYETHYNMGIAYKEMDLLDEAIREFQAAAALVKENDGTAHFLHCCNMLGHCFMRKELPKAAARWFKKGLEALGHGEDEYQALRYELGIAFEQMGDLDRAIDAFTEVYSVDISYRGVGEKLGALQTLKNERRKKRKQDKA
jgi:tetratricopeptide (TPR) repeat protein